MRIKRVYEVAAAQEGERFLVDRLWPRGLRKEAVQARAWAKAAAPSEGLRRWFNHQPAKWPEFQRRYFAELDEHPESWKPLLAAAREGDITLLYGARDPEHNNAAALKLYLDRRLGAKGRAG